MFRVIYEHHEPWPEEGPLTIDTRLHGDIKVSPELARRRANRFLAMDVGVLLGADDPVLVWGEKPVWRFNVHLYLPQTGCMGMVGMIEVDALSGDVIHPSVEQIKEIQDCARDLAIHHAPEAKAVG